MSIYIWDKKDIPSRGWVWEDIEDHGEPSFVCWKCSNPHVRWVHVLSHRECEDIKVGCVCAEKLTEDYVNPAKREAEFKKKVEKARRAKTNKEKKEAWMQKMYDWCNHDWRTSIKGNLWKKTPLDTCITIFQDQKDLGWKYCIVRQAGKIYSVAHVSAMEATVAAFTQLFPYPSLEEKLPKGKKKRRVKA